MKNELDTSSSMSISEPVSVTVKPLEWFDVSEGSEKHRANPPIGPTYTVEDDGFTEGYHVNACQLVLGNFASLEAAKDAAQADYERRVLAALSHVQAPAEPGSFQAMLDAPDDEPVGLVLEHPEVSHRLYAHPTPQIDDAMVERACSTFYINWNLMPEGEAKAARIGMMYALVAAIGDAKP